MIIKNSYCYLSQNTIGKVIFNAGSVMWLEVLWRYVNIVFFVSDRLAHSFGYFIIAVRIWNEGNRVY